MKKVVTITLGVGLLVLGFAYAHFEGGREEYNAPNVVTNTVVEEKEVQTLDFRIKTAQNAKMGQIEASAQAAYDAAYENAMNEVALEVTTAYEKEVAALKLELQKKTTSY